MVYPVHTMIPESSFRQVNDGVCFPNQQMIQTDMATYWNLLMKAPVTKNSLHPHWRSWSMWVITYPAENSYRWGVSTLYVAISASLGPSLFIIGPLCPIIALCFHRVTVVIQIQTISLSLQSSP